MAGLYFLVLAAVGILRPIRNALALDGLGETEFYQVYLVSAIVILAVPPYNRLANRVRWHILIPGVAAFFAVSLVLLRLVYSRGSGTFGLLFYGYYDLFAAALVTQFFMAVQLFFNARDAKSAIPLVIIGGSLGATLGGLTTGLLSKAVGTPNLMLVAAAFIGMFAAALPFVWAGYPPVKPPPGKTLSTGRLSAGELFRVFSHRHIRLIAGLVLITILVKTMVDYEFNEVVALYAGSRDAISSFQGFFLGATQWLPILVLLGLGALLKRWGVGMAVLILPIVMLLSTVGLALAFGVWAALGAKACDTTFRYSAERTAREVLYLPIPTDLKLRAKAYIDMAIEKGVAKVFAAVVIMLLIQRMSLATIPWVIVALCVVWIVGALSVRRAYLATLADSIRGRFASLQGTFASLTERNTLAFVEDALRGDPAQVAFALDLVEQAGRVDAEPLADELEMLLSHDSAALRERVLRLLARFPGLVPRERVMACLSDPDPAVRQATVAAVAACEGEPAKRERTLMELLDSPEAPVRHAVLTALVRREVTCDRSAVIGSQYLADRMGARIGGDGDAASQARPEAREELALALGLVDEYPGSSGLLEKLIDDPDPRVARAALSSAGSLHRPELVQKAIASLADPELRREARAALAAHDGGAIEPLEAALEDAGHPLSVRRQIPSVLARIRSQESADALQRVLRAPGLDPEVELQTLKALNKLRTRGDPERPLAFEASVAMDTAARAVTEAHRYEPLPASERDDPGLTLLRRALDEAWEECRERAFRCLGLVYPPDGIHRAYLTLTRGDERAQANAIEWLNEALGHDGFVGIEPILERPGERKRAAGRRSDMTATISELCEAPNRWIAELATWNTTPVRSAHLQKDNGTMDRIEKLFLLQKVDLLQGAKSSHLALLASIAEEVEVAKGTEIIRQGETNDALYVVIRGSVELRGMGDQRLVAEENTPFGTWALIDSDASIVDARAVEPSLLLRITRTDFQDLLADHPELAMGMLQGLARRLRGLVA